ncbi:MAG TPA: hypothetical protein VI911_08450 [Patescibacteria group bacterium]|nr:hypothetical protein [Patescibacteria group bacterium]
MKIVVEIVTAIILLVSGNYLAPKLIQKFQKETLIKLDRGLSPLSKFSSGLTRKK